MNPFRYPKARHIRRQQPGPYRDAARYKPALQVEFERKCVYCRAPDTVRGSESFGVDHYRPKGKFPGLATAYENLFYACNACNSRKGAYWPRPREQSTRFVPNPCDHEMFRHLRFQGAEVEARSDPGRVAVELLDLNASDAVAWRNLVLKALELADRNAEGLARLRLQLLGRARANPDPGLDDAIASIDRELASLDEHRRRLAGE